MNTIIHLAHSRLRAVFAAPDLNRKKMRKNIIIKPKNSLGKIIKKKNKTLVGHTQSVASIRLPKQKFRLFVAVSISKQVLL